MTHEALSENGPFWERACAFYLANGLHLTPGNYFIHEKYRGRVKIGLDCRLILRRREEDGDGDMGWAEAYASVDKALDQEAPVFFLVSPDFVRKARDPALPDIVFAQPGVEIEFSARHPDGHIHHARDAAQRDQVQGLLDAARPRAFQALPRYDVPRLDFGTLSRGWTSPEDDAGFLSRLIDIIERLQSHPDGKITPTRSFHYRATGGKTAFALYIRHAYANGDYACSHFFCLREEVYSIGTSPENVFEIDGSTLNVDVVAATCASGATGRTLRDELTENEKQAREHLGALENRIRKFSAFVDGSSVQVVKDRHLKKLRNVFHLHSAFRAELGPGIGFLDILEHMLPMIGARPKELLAVADPQTSAHRYYGGIVGHHHRDQTGCYLNIRNVLIDKTDLHAKVGTGVIRESDAQAELAETRNKISGIFESVHAWDLGL